MEGNTRRRGIIQTFFTIISKGMDVYVRGELSNGVEYIIAPNEGSAVCAIGVWIKVGAVDENPSMAGISHFVEHMLFRGGKKYKSNKEIFNRFAELGATHNGETLKDYTIYYAKGYKKYIEDLMEIIADFVLNPLFPRDVMERERQIIIEEINSYLNDPNKLIKELMSTHVLGRKNVLSHSIGGTKESVGRITWKAIVNFYQEHYVSGNIVVSISGGIDVEKGKEIIRKYFGNITKKEGVKRQIGKYGDLDADQVRILTKKLEGPQEKLILAFPLFAFGDPRKYAMTVLNIILAGITSSRLFFRVREKLGLVYGIKGNDELFWGGGWYYIITAMEPDNLGKVLKEVIDELRRIKKEKVKIEELQKAKKYITNSLYLSTENALRNSAFYGIQVLYGEKIMTYSDVVQEVEKVSIEDVLRIAGEVLRMDKMLIVAVGPKGNLKTRNLLSS